jgi:hypothetical protein
MKKIIAIGALSLALSFHSFSFAAYYTELYIEPPSERSEFKNETRGGKIEKDFMSFYINPKEANSTTTSSVAERKINDDKDYIVVFGVQVPVSSETNGKRSFATTKHYPNALAAIPTKITGTVTDIRGNTLTVVDEMGKNHLIKAAYPKALQGLETGDIVKVTIERRQATSIQRLGHTED